MYRVMVMIDRGCLVWLMILYRLAGKAEAEASAALRKVSYFVWGASPLLLSSHTSSVSPLVFIVFVCLVLSPARASSLSFLNVGAAAIAALIVVGLAHGLDADGECVHRRRIVFVFDGCCVECAWCLFLVNVVELIGFVKLGGVYVKLFEIWRLWEWPGLKNS